MIDGPDETSACNLFTMRGSASLSDEIITRAEWSPDGTLIAAPTQAGTVHILEREKLRIVRSEHVSAKALWACAWSSDSGRLALGGRDNSVHVYDVVRGTKLFDLAGTSGPAADEGHRDDVHAVHWSSDDTTLLTSSFDGTLKLWSAENGVLLRTISAHIGRVEDCLWDTDRGELISAGRDGAIRIWSVEDGRLVAETQAHRGFVLRLLAPVGQKTLLSSSSDGSVRVWDRRSLTLLHVIRGFAGTPHDVSLSADGQLLAVKDDNESVRVYRADTFEYLDQMHEVAEHHHWYGRAAFHPLDDELLTTGNGDRRLHIWSYDLEAVANARSESTARSYANCRVGLLGNTGVGKTSLANALTGAEFRPTTSTHATKVSLLDRSANVPVGDKEVVRETFLWDFAGQPAYRLLQRFDVQGLAVALLLLDSRNATDPVQEIAEWETLLKLASGPSDPGPPRIVVVARVDRGGLPGTVTDETWARHVDRLVGVVETSAKEARNIPELRDLILSSIDWESLPSLTSDAQFQRLRMYVRQIASQGEVVDKVHSLLAAFSAHCERSGMDLPTNAEFRALLVGLEAEGLLKLLGFGDLVLLEPTLLRSYGSMILLAAQGADDGLGRVDEDEVLAAAIPLLSDERIADPARERDLLHAAVQEFIASGVVLRSGTPAQLHFPSAVRRPLDTATWDGLDPGCVYALDASLDHAWSTLVVTLSSSGLFGGWSLWNYAARFDWDSETGGSWLHVQRNGVTSIAVELRHEPGVATLQRALIQELVRSQLERDAVRGTFSLAIAVSCPECHTLIPEQQVQRRLSRGMTDIVCNVCDHRIELAPPATPHGVGSIEHIESQAEATIVRSAVSAAVEIKEKRDIFDVFLSYSHQDARGALELAESLRQRGIRPWIDVWELPPGKPWLAEMSSQLADVSAAAVLIGPSGIGPWQQDEANYLLQQFFARRCPVIPVLLPGANEPKMPTMLAGMQWVDFRRQYPDPLARLVWGVTGVRPDGGGR